jgi:hypothetical protein
VPPIQPAQAMVKDFGTNSYNIRVVATEVFLMISHAEKMVKGEFSIEHFYNGTDKLINRFVYPSIADNTMLVKPNGEMPEEGYGGPLITEWAYFTYLMTQYVKIPELVEAYATVLFERGKFDQPKDLIK